MMDINMTPFLVSFKLAAVTTVLLLAVSFPFALFLSFKEFRLKPLLESLITLPAVLPPTVLGFYLIIIFSPEGIAGRLFSGIFDTGLLFSFPGIVLASCIYSFPLMVLPLKNGLDNIDRAIIEASFTLGKSKLETLISVIIPNMKISIYSALITVFAHTIGGFGVVLMVGGNIPGVTRVASIAIYEWVEKLDFTNAHVYSGILVSISLVIIFLLNRINGRGVRSRGV
jgi:molybdate transport system permease protein